MASELTEAYVELEAAARAALDYPGPLDAGRAERVRRAVAGLDDARARVRGPLDAEERAGAAFVRLLDIAIHCTRLGRHANIGGASAFLEETKETYRDVFERFHRVAGLGERDRTRWGL